MPDRVRGRATLSGARKDEDFATRTATHVARPSAHWMHSMQRTVGNAAVARMLEARAHAATRSLARFEGDDTPTAEPPVFKNTTISTVPGVEEATQKQLEAFNVLDGTYTGVWPNLKWNYLVRGAVLRILNPVKINQNVLEVCGPAAALHATAGRDPLDYARLVVEIYTRGTANGKRVNDKLRNGTPAGEMHGVDWMVLSTMQDVTNSFISFEGTAEEKYAQGYLPPGMESLLADFAGCVKTTHYSCMLWGKQAETIKASNLIATHGEDVVVVMAVASQVLNDPDEKAWAPNHFVRLLEPVVWTDQKVSATVFTWGSVRDIEMTPPQFETLVYGFTVGARNKEIAL